MEDSSDDVDLRSYFLENYIHHTDNFVEKTSMHAVKQVHYRKCGSLKQIFWIFVILCFFGASFYGGQKLLIKFLQLPSQTDVKIESKSDGFTFPDVTFCDPFSQKLRNTIVPLNKNQVVADESLLKLTNLSDIIIESILKDEYLNMSRVQQLKTKSMAQEHFLNLSSMYPRALDRIIMCKYNGEDCNFSYFSTTYDRDYHNCYTFHSDIQPRVGKNFGLFVLFLLPTLPNNGGWTERMDIINDLTSASVLVDIGQSNSLVRPAKTGYSIPLNMMTDIEITQRKMEVQEGSNLYYKCEAPSTLSYRDLQFEQDRFYQRDISDCIDSEYLHNISKICGCHVEGPTQLSDVDSLNGSKIEYCSNIMDSFFINNKMRLLNYLNDSERMSAIDAMINNATGREAAERVRCLWRNYKSFAEREIYYYQSSCKPNCEYKFFKKNVIQTPWPQRGSFLQISGKTQMLQIARTIRDYFNLLNIDAKNLSTKTLDTAPQLMEVFKSYNIVNADEILNGCEKNSWDLKNCSILMNIIGENMVLVNIFAGVDTSINYYFVLSFDIIDLLSKVGGTFSLWVGFSVLTLVEIGELFLRFGYVAVQMCIMKHRKSQPQSLVLKNEEVKKTYEKDNAGYVEDETEKHLSAWI